MSGWAKAMVLLAALRLTNANAESRLPKVSAPRPAAPPTTSSRRLMPCERPGSDWSDMDYLLDAVELLALGSHDDLGHGHVRRLAERVDHRLGHVFCGQRLDLVE